MNKEITRERAKEILKKIKDEKVEYLTIEDIQEPESEDIPRIQEQIQVLDIAIERLEQNIQTIIVEREFTLEEMNKGLEYCTYKAHRELIKRLLELKLIDIKSMNDIFGKGIVEFRLKVLDPYERKE